MFKASRNITLANTAVSTLFVQSTIGSRQPTLESAEAWDRLYKYLNRRLFGGKLPPCKVTETRKPGTLGYFKRHAFADKSGFVCHEISINPTGVALYGDAEAMGTLTHEMCHLWREVLGPANRNGSKGARGYHDLVWARKMEEIGLMPSDTGRPGGKKTGFRVSHYVIEGGLFDIACRELLVSYFEIPWADNVMPLTMSASAGMGDVVSEEPTAKPTRARFLCQGCDLKAYAKHSARLICGDCQFPLIAT